MLILEMQYYAEFDLAYQNLMKAKKIYDPLLDKYKRLTKKGSLSN